AAGRDVDGARVARIDHDAADVVRIGEAEVAPGPAPVRRLEDAGPAIRSAARVVLAAAEIDRLPVRVGEGDVADGDGRLVLEEGSRASAPVVRAPEAAGGEGHDVGIRMSGRPLDVHDAAALDFRSHRPEAQSLQERLPLPLQAQILA